MDLKPFFLFFFSSTCNAIIHTHKHTTNTEIPHNNVLRTEREREIGNFKREKKTTTVMYLRPRWGDYKTVPGRGHRC